MTQNELLADVVQKSFEMLAWHLADFSDADMLVRPVPNANHAAWQVAHLANFAVMQAAVVSGGEKLTLPENFAKSQGPEAAKSDDPAAFPSKAELLGLIQGAVSVQVAAIGKLSSEDFAKPAPEKMRSFAPTIGHLIQLGPQHLAMHVGQIQVIRRKLGKPVLF
jgi:hypothetical protein